MPGGGAEVPNPRLTRTGKQRVTDQLVASPLADDGAGDISNVVLIEAQDRAQIRLRQGFARACEAITMQTTEIDAFFEVHLRGAGRLQWPVPTVSRLEIVFVDRQEF